MIFFPESYIIHVKHHFLLHNIVSCFQQQKKKTENWWNINFSLQSLMKQQYINVP